jgi:hypothetical protein
MALEIILDGRSRSLVFYCSSEAAIDTSRFKSESVPVSLIYFAQLWKASYPIMKQIEVGL